MQLTTLPLDRIHPDPDNIRDNADDADIASLAADIAQHGLLQPCTVYQVDDGDVAGVPGGDYVISGGHRRYYALKHNGVTDTDVSIRPKPVDDLERLDLMGSENLHRRQLNPIEEARYYRRYLDTGMSQQAVAARVGKTQTHVSRFVLLLDFSADIQGRIASGELGLSAAIELMRKIRKDNGTARRDSSAGGHARSVKVPYFNTSHPLHATVSERCRYHGHDPLIRVGGACGPCWERAIRLAAGADLVPASADPPPADVPRQREKFSDPREILRRLKCTRCSTTAIDRESRRCFIDRDGKRRVFDHHEYVMEVAADV